MSKWTIRNCRDGKWDYEIVEQNTERVVPFQASEYPRFRTIVQRHNRSRETCKPANSDIA